LQTTPQESSSFASNIVKTTDGGDSNKTQNPVQTTVPQISLPTEPAGMDNNSNISALSLSVLSNKGPVFGQGTVALDSDPVLPQNQVATTSAIIKPEKDDACNMAAG